MDDRKLDRIESKIDKLTDRIGSIDVTLASQHESLKEHIRRTELLETDVAPIKRHVAMIQGVLKFIMLLSVLVGIVTALTKWT